MSNSTYIAITKQFRHWSQRVELDPSGAIVATAETIISEIFGY